MERRNGSITVTAPLFEGSGSSNVTSSPRNISILRYTIFPSEWTDGMTRIPSSQDRITLDKTTSTMDETQPDPNNGTVLLQTNILLIAVLVVCFATLAAVVAMCACFLRRYCKKHQIAQSLPDLYHTTLVSKATSITGLNVAHEYYSTKVEKKDQHFSPTIIAENKCEKSTTCELGSGRIVESTPSIISSRFEPLSPTCQVPREDAAQIYFKMKNVLTSTPAAVEPQYVIAEVDQAVPQAPNCTVSSPVSHQGVIYSTASPPSVYASALSSQQVNMQISHPATQQDLSYRGTSHHQPPVRCMLKGPLTQSVSWFVPLNGIQREPLRHSVVEVTPDEINTDQTQFSGYIQSEQQCTGNGKLKKYTPDESATIHENPQEKESPRNPFKTNLELPEHDANSEASSTAAENVPLMNDKENVTPNTSARSLPLKRSRLKSAASDDSPDNGTDSGNHTRSRSLSSPDDNNMWKQREERPVLFLGSGIK